MPLLQHQSLGAGGWQRGTGNAGRAEGRGVLAPLLGPRGLGVPRHISEMASLVMGSRAAGTMPAARREHTDSSQRWRACCPHLPAPACGGACAPFRPPLCLRGFLAPV